MKCKKILVEIHHGIGDVVQMIPVIKNIKDNYKDAEIGVIVASNVQEQILEMTHLVDKFYHLSFKDMKFTDIVKFILEIRKEKYDIGFLSPISNKKMGAVLLYLLGCKKRVGEYSPTQNLLINHNIKVEEDNSLHRVERNLNLLTAAGLNITNEKASLTIPQHFINNANQIVLGVDSQKKTVGICIGTNPVEMKKKDGIVSVEAKKWPLKNYIELMKRLSSSYNILLIGGKKEEDEIANVREEINSISSVINCINKTNLIESAALLNRCDLVIGGDTGMLHLADALDKHTVTIFGPSNPKLVGPYSDKANNISIGIPCQFCYGTETILNCTDRICLTNITTESIYRRVINILN